MKRIKRLSSVLLCLVLALGLLAPTMALAESGAQEPAAQTDGGTTTPDATTTTPDTTTTTPDTTTEPADGGSTQEAEAKVGCSMQGGASQGGLIGLALLVVLLAGRIRRRDS